jgi:cytochrome P450
MSSVPEVIKTGRKEVKRRLDQRQDMEYRDYFEQLMPSDGIPPSGPSEMRALEQLVTQMLFAQYETISTWWYSTLFYLVREVEMQQHLAEEIRSSFERYEDIVPSALGSLKYLEACLNESLRLFPSSNTGLPRESPGASVDGVYLPKGVRLVLFLTIAFLRKLT